MLLLNKHIKYQTGIAMPAVVIAVVILIVLGAGGYLFFSQKKESVPSAKTPAEQSLQVPEQTGVVAEYPKELVGLWRAERAYQYNPATESLVPMGITLDNYFEFRADGTRCAEWVQVEGGLKPNKCTKYEVYIVQGDIISSSGLDSPAAKGRFKWRIINDNKLELTIEIFSDKNRWQPLFQYVLERVGP